MTGAAWCLSGGVGGLLACAIIAINGEPDIEETLRKMSGKSKERACADDRTGN